MIQQTSIQSFNEIDVSITNKLQQAILSILKAFPYGLSDSEIISYLSKEAIKLEPRVRRNELYKLGLIKCIGKRVCSITNKKVMVWIINNNKYNNI